MSTVLTVSHTARAQITGYEVTAADWRLFLRSVPLYAVVSVEANGHGAILKAEWALTQESNLEQPR